MSTKTTKRWPLYDPKFPLSTGPLVPVRGTINELTDEERKASVVREEANGD